MFFTSYRDLFECPCPKLAPALPFRSIAREQIIADFLTFQPTKKTRIVYVADRPGGLLFDFILINQLIEAGYTDLQIIIIEPLSRLRAIRRAQEQFRDYFENINVKATIFQTWDQYAAKIAETPQLRGTCLITIDPDNARDLPDPENRHKNYLWHKKITCMCQQFFWTALYQQELPTNSNRHLFTGTGTITTQKNIFITARHRQGLAALDQQEHRVWLNYQALFPADLPPVLGPEQVDLLAAMRAAHDRDRPR